VTVCISIITATLWHVYVYVCSISHRCLWLGLYPSSTLD